MPTLGTPLAPDLITPGSCWQLLKNLNGYARAVGESLATQAAAGRSFRVISPVDKHSTRVQVTLLEDGYPCWLNVADLAGQARASTPSRPQLFSSQAIAARIPEVLDWLKIAADRPNEYLWGGTLGPNLDCSGLVQCAFASAGIWLPRDAYQQERFCEPVAVRPGNDRLLQPGDLIFFGRPQRCTHVAIHLERGRYMHSSGREHGRNGIGIDSLHPTDRHPVASHYRRELRGAGRIMRCHDGTTLN